MVLYIRYTHTHELKRIPYYLSNTFPHSFTLQYSTWGRKYREIIASQCAIIHYLTNPIGAYHSVNIICQPSFQKRWWFRRLLLLHGCYIFYSHSILKLMGQLREQCLCGHHGLGSNSDYSLGMRIWEFSREFVRISWEFRYMKNLEKVWRVNFAPPTWELALYCQTRMLFYYEKDRFLPESFLFNTSPRQINLLPSALP